MGKILVINPNSSTLVTRSMERCLAPVMRATRHDIGCVELAKSPPGIETDADVAAVVPNIIEAVTGSAADAFVVACFSDPGLDAVRAATAKPVAGIAEAAYLSAMAMGRRFGIYSLGPSSIARHRRYLQVLAIEGRLAGDRSIDKGVADADDPDTLERLIRIGSILRDTDGADVLILGCAGLGGYRAILEKTLGLPVVDPVQAATMALGGQLDLNYPARA